MTTFTEVLPERKASKHSAINWTPAEGNDFAPLAGVLVIHTDRASVTYGVAEFPTDFAGRGCTLAKVTTGTDPESESYSVFCGRSPFTGDQCCCKGFTYNRTCKHVDAVRALLANGWL
jgi:hypothetical protein